MRRSLPLLILGLFAAGSPLAAQAPDRDSAGQQSPGQPAQQQAPMTADETMALAMKAAPPDVSRDATIVQPDAQGQMKTLREGTNGWVCMASPEVMCLDAPWQAWAEAWMNKAPVKIDRVGVAYMLQGDTGASNTDPFATKPTADNQWVQTGPHLMIVVPDPAQLEGLPTDPYAGGPFVMWKGTPYAHIMVPVESMPTQEHGPATRR